MIRLLIPVVILLGGCATSEKEYYSALEKRNARAIEAFKTQKQEGFTFEGDFKGKMTFTGKAIQPQLQGIQAPKSSSDVALQWISALSPAAIALGSMHYNYKTNEIQATTARDIAISTSADNASIFNGYASNFKNDNSVSTTDLSNITTDSISDYSDTITDTSTTTDTDTRTTTQVVPSVEVLDGNVTIN